MSKSSIESDSCASLSSSSSMASYSSGSISHISNLTETSSIELPEEFLDSSQVLDESLVKPYQEKAIAEIKELISREEVNRIKINVNEAVYFTEEMVKEISEYVNSSDKSISICLNRKIEEEIWLTRIRKNLIEIVGDPEEVTTSEDLEEFIAKCIYIYGHFDKFSSSNEVCSTSTSSSTSLFSSTVSSESSFMGESVSHSEEADS